MSVQFNPDQLHYMRYVFEIKLCDVQSEIADPETHELDVMYLKTELDTIKSIQALLNKER